MEPSRHLKCSCLTVYILLKGVACLHTIRHSAPCLPQLLCCSSHICVHVGSSFEVSWCWHTHTHIISKIQLPVQLWCWVYNCWYLFKPCWPFNPIQSRRTPGQSTVSQTFTIGSRIAGLITDLSQETKLAPVRTSWDEKWMVRQCLRWMASLIQSVQKSDVWL